jgi:hypothetical protein
MAMIIKTFYCYEIYNGFIESDEYYPGSSKILAGMAALMVQSGIIIAPIASMILSDSISIGYRIMIGGILGVILTSIKDAFTDTTMQKLRTGLKEMNSKMKLHDDRLGVHDANHKRHDANHTRHDANHTRHDANHTRHDANHTRHDANHTRHDANHTRHDANHTRHDAGMSNLRADIEWNNPCKWVPWDPPSPK